MSKATSTVQPDEVILLDADVHAIHNGMWNKVNESIEPGKSLRDYGYTFYWYLFDPDQIPTGFDDLLLVTKLASPSTLSHGELLFFRRTGKVIKIKSWTLIVCEITNA